ncbi:MAG: hypothetical protein WC277_08535 [Bacilli bacterium]
MAENPAVKDRIRKHVAGVFGLREESLPEVILKKDVPEGAPTAAPAPAPKREEPKPAPDPAPKKEEPKPAPASVPVPKTEPKTEEPKQPPAPKTEGAPAATCEECGAGITEAQKKISLLFTDKTLCKKCMEGSSGGKS